MWCGNSAAGPLGGWVARGLENAASLRGAFSMHCKLNRDDDALESSEQLCLAPALRNLVSSASKLLPTKQRRNRFVFFLSGCANACLNKFPFAPFFPSCASVLSPGRRTLLCWLNELRICIHCIPLYGLEMGHRPLQSEVLSVHKGRQNRTQKTYQQNKNQTKQPKTTKANKPNHESQQRKCWQDGSKRQQQLVCRRIKRSAHERERNLRRCPAKHIIQQHRNPGSPLPGSRRSHWGALQEQIPFCTCQNPIQTYFHQVLDDKHACNLTAETSTLGCHRFRCPGLCVLQ